MCTDSALISAEEWTLFPGESGTFAKYVLVAALNRTRRLGRRLAVVVACGPIPAARRRPVWDYPAVWRVDPGEPRRSSPSHHGCLRLFELDGPVNVTAAG